MWHGEGGKLDVHRSRIFQGEMMEGQLGKGVNDIGKRVVR